MSMRMGKEGIKETEMRGKYRRNMEKEKGTNRTRGRKKSSKRDGGVKKRKNSEIISKRRVKKRRIG